MLAFLGNISGFDFSFLIMMMVITFIPGILFVWLIIEIIRYLRRH